MGCCVNITDIPITRHFLDEILEHKIVLLRHLAVLSNLMQTHSLAVMEARANMSRRNVSECTMGVLKTAIVVDGCGNINDYK